MNNNWIFITVIGSEKSINEIINSISVENNNIKHIETLNFINVIHIKNIENDCYSQIVKNIKNLTELPEWVVISRGNIDNKSGDALILQRYSKTYMDVIDIVIGDDNNYGLDVQNYIEESHNEFVPVWLLENLCENCYIDDFKLANIPDDIPINNNIETYSLKRKLSDEDIPYSVPREIRTDSPNTEIRTIKFDTETYDYLKGIFKKYTEIELDDTFNNNEFNGTWDELNFIFWETIDNITANLDNKKTIDKLNKIKWESVIKWHTLQEGDEYISTSTRY